MAQSLKIGNFYLHPDTVCFVDFRNGEYMIILTTAGKEISFPFGSQEYKALQQWYVSNSIDISCEEE